MVLTIAMNRERAWEKLNDPNYAGQLNMVEFEKLLLRAGYSPRAAHKAAMKRGEDRLDAGISV